MPSTGIRAAGLDQVRKALKKSGDDLSDFKATNREVAQWITDRSKPGMPHVSGALAASTRPGAAAAKATVKVGGSRVPYAGPILWGWRRRNIRPARTTPYSVALGTFDQWIDLYWDRVNRILDKIKGA